MKNEHITRMGKSAALSAAFFSIAYSISAILTLLNMIRHPYSLFWQFLPSLLLAFAFVVVLICLHFSAPYEFKIYTAVATAFAIIYCTCVSIVYFTQLSVVIPQSTQQEVRNENVLAFTGRSFMVAVDCLGYTIMSLATFMASFAFKAGSKHKWLYRGLLYHGLLAPVILLSFFIPTLMYVGTLWMITMPLAMINVALFYNMPPDADRDQLKKRQKGFETFQSIEYETTQ